MPSFVKQVDGGLVIPRMTDWVSWTPTGSWNTNVTYTGRWRRVGDSAEYYVKVVTSGAPNSTGLTINLPSGHVIDTTRFASSTDTFTLGIGHILDTGTAYYLSLIHI